MTPLGIGLFLGIVLAIPLAFGAAIRFMLDRKKENLVYTGILIAAGVMGGEGLAGFGTGALSVLGIDYLDAANLIIIFAAFLLFVTIVLCGFHSIKD
jgi:uncharacterized oligopeptide transporter (OPT) family protein